MPLETAKFIFDLQPDWPLGTDPESQGDDHLRMIKQVVQNTFPNLNGAVTGTPEELNNLCQITWRNMDDNPSQYPYHGYWQPDDPAGTGAATMTSATLNAAMASAVPSSVINWKMVQNLIYPVHCVLISSNSANPATYLGFGTWTQRSGSIYGVGNVTDSGGLAWNIPLGAVSGNWRVQNSMIVASTLNLTMDAVSGHSHTTQMKLGGVGSTGDGSTHYASTGSGNNDGTPLPSNSAGGHTPTGKVTIGSGAANAGSMMRSPGYALYIWERTA